MKPVTPEVTSSQSDVRSRTPIRVAIEEEPAAVQNGTEREPTPASMYREDHPDVRFRPSYQEYFTKVDIL